MGIIASTDAFERDQIVNDLKEYIERHGYEPIRDEFITLGICTQWKMRKHFGTYPELLAQAKRSDKKAALNQAYDSVRDPAAHVKVSKQNVEIVQARRSDEMLSQYIAHQIEKCADELAAKPCDLTWFDFREYSKIAYGKNAVGITPRDITRVGGFNTIRDAYFPPTPTLLSQEKSRIHEHAKLNRKLASVADKQEAMLVQIEQFADRVFKDLGGLGQILPKHPVDSKSERVITANISDVHIGSDLSKAETGGLDYGVAEESRRMAFLCREIVNYKPAHRDETDLVLNILGDIIQGKLHDPLDGAVLAEQICRAIHLFIQFIAHCSRNFKKVTVHFDTGNHGRDKARHHQRATFQKWDSHETVIYYSIQAALKHLPNVTFVLKKTPYVRYELFGRKYLALHGDTVLNPGYPGKSINIKSLEDQINRINASLPDMDEYAVVQVGHVHIGSVTFLGNGVVMMTNGAVTPPDNFATSIGIMESQCLQWIYESTPEYAVGDLRAIRFDRKVDRDETLDAIISPWKGLSE